MRSLKIYRRILICLFMVNIFLLGFYFYSYLEKHIPNEIKIMVGEKESFDFNMPLKADIETDNVGVISVNDLKVPSNQINIDLNHPFTLKSSQKGEYEVVLKLFGIFKFKNISLDVIDAKEVIPCGNPVGIYVETNGILVLGGGRITGDDGLNYEPINNKLKSGDYILKINNKSVSLKKDLIDEIQRCDGKDITLLIRRNKEEFTVSITPVKTSSGNYKIGAWIRDNTQGIGTLTFITPDGQFGALGHGITDIDSGVLMDVKEGSIYKAQIMSIVKGKEGEPGELIGMIKQSGQYKMGHIKENTYQGIYGEMDSDITDAINSKPLKIGLKQEVRKGKATIRCTVQDKIEDYDIQIVSIDMNSSNNSKGIVLKITDPKLLKLTGGIVQGMSGSPIIQNNKIIGAVTHVFIQDSTKGYGTFIENMVNNLE